MSSILKSSHLPLLRIFTAFVFTVNILCSSVPFCPAIRSANAEVQYIEADITGLPRTALLERLRELEGTAAALADETQSLEKSVKSGQNDITKGTERIKKELLNIESKISQMETLAQKIDQSAAEASQLAKECYDAAETAAALRGTIQDFVLKGCQEAAAVKASFDADKLKSSLDVVRLQCASARDENEKFITQMSVARANKQQIEKIKKNINTAPFNRDMVKPVLEEMKTQMEQLKLQWTVVENNLQAILTKPAGINGIKGEAAGITELIKTAAEPPDTAQKKIIKETDALSAKITRHETNTASAVERSKTNHEGLAQKISSLDQQLNAFQNRFASLPDNVMVKQSLAQILNAAKNAGATVDAAKPLQNAVSQSVNQCGKCLGSVESLVAQRTTPDAQVARHDCSPWPGTIAQWNSAKTAPYCVCTPGNLWDEPLFKCVTEAQYYVPRTDCSGYGANVHAAWDAKQRQAACYCIDGYEWNNGRTACRVNAQAQVSSTDCSMYPQTKPVWDAANESVVCSCRQGYSWDGSRCVR
jgi:chromosome segregation ATPase